MKKLFLASAVVTAVLLSGCMTVPFEPTKLVDTSWYSKPSEGNAGIYFYQYKSGIWGAAYDVGFKLDGEVLGKINTGEWLYFEVPAGIHEYYSTITLNRELNFIAGQNYFFRGGVDGFTSNVVLVIDEPANNRALKNIESGRYEHGDVD